MHPTFADLFGCRVSVLITRARCPHYELHNWNALLSFPLPLIEFVKFISIFYIAYSHPTENSEVILEILILKEVDLVAKVEGDKDIFFIVLNSP